MVCRGCQAYTQTRRVANQLKPPQQLCGNCTHRRGENFNTLIDRFEIFYTLGWPFNSEKNTNFVRRLIEPFYKPILVKFMTMTQFFDTFSTWHPDYATYASLSQIKISPRLPKSVFNYSQYMKQRNTVIKSHNSRRFFFSLKKLIQRIINNLKMMSSK